MAKSFPHFDPLTAPLRGRTLVEASAGTGKTWTIAALFVRLLVEEGLEVENILVVTYTEAATAELRERIRGRLGEALACLAGEGGDDFLVALARRCPDPGLAAARLRRALLNFEQAAIHTIHGFCQRVLRDRAFEARALFDTELATDLSALEEELADDFWRRRSPSFSPPFADFLLQMKYGPDALLQLPRSGRRPERILPELAAVDLSRSEADCQALWGELAALWRAEREAIVGDFLACLPGLRKGSYSPEKILAWARQLDVLLAGAGVLGGDDGIKGFSAPTANKGQRAPAHPFFALCATFKASRDTLQKACGAALLVLQRDYLLWREEESSRRKLRHNVRTFDDLLLDVRAALTGDECGGLTTALREAFRAVLIDEFQDTDPVQYAIFEALCPDERASLFLIGDPKQAIYAFRGADIFTYLVASERVERRATLGINRRSAPPLVQGVNALFARPNPFLFDAIPYPEVAADQQRNRHLAVRAADGGAPLRLWTPSPEDEAMGQGEATAAIVAAVVAEIVRLLGDGARLCCGSGEERSLSAGDIAVLVRTNRQAALMVEALRSAGVAGVRQGSESLFASREAGDLLSLLQALAAPHDVELLRGALATPYFGYDAAALARTVDDVAVLEPWLARWREYRQLWAERGVAVFSGLFMLREGLAPRLLALPDGERRLTNLRHCLEVLHRAESEHGLRLEGLLKWFSRHIAAPPSGEEYQLRLETDATAVQVVTIHRSKGLEYPICFVPFCWNGSRIGAHFRNEPFHFHLPGYDGRRGPLCLDLGSGKEERERYQELCEREALAENLRLCYVALTRAQARCYLVWGLLKGAESSALAWLLHAPDEVPPGVELAACEAAVAGLDGVALAKRLAALADPATLAVEALPGAAGTLAPAISTSDALSAPPAPRAVRSQWRLTSYSALVAGAHQGGEWEERLRLERGESPGAQLPIGEEGEGAIHAFPAGAEAGSCLHDILEAVDFTAPADDVRRRLIAETLLRYRIDPLWTAEVEGLLERLRTFPLDPAFPGLCLGRITMESRCSEMGFFLPLTPFDCTALADVFARHRDHLPDPRLPEAVGQLAFGTVEGMLRGFVDLVFVDQGRYFLADWKSNRLGRMAGDYHRAAMAEEMLASGYLLQYHLYCVALHRHLRRTLPGYDYERHFGGVYYLFLRGITGTLPECGNFRDRPHGALLADLDRLLGGEV